MQCLWLRSWGKKITLVSSEKIEFENGDKSILLAFFWNVRTIKTPTHGTSVTVFYRIHLKTFWIFDWELEGRKQEGQKINCFFLQSSDNKKSDATTIVIFFEHIFYYKFPLSGWDLNERNWTCTYGQTFLRTSKNVQIKSTSWKFRTLRIPMQLSM